jgi:thiol-disulfide isomerase/thioredoxin
MDENYFRFCTTRHEIPSHMRIITLLFILIGICSYGQVEITEEQSQSLIKIEGTGFTMLEFFSSGCAYSQKMEPLYSRLAEEFKSKCKFYRLNIDKHRNYDFGLDGTPTFVVYDNEKQLQYRSGFMDYEELKEFFLNQLNHEEIEKDRIKSVKSELTNEIVFLKAFKYLIENFADNLSSENLGTKDIDKSFNIISNQINSKENIKSDNRVIIGTVTYEIITELDKIDTSKWFPFLWDNVPDMYREMDFEFSGKIEDGFAVKTSFVDEVNSSVEIYLFYGIDTLNNEYKIFHSQYHIVGM